MGFFSRRRTQTVTVDPLAQVLAQAAAPLGVPAIGQPNPPRPIKLRPGQVWVSRQDNPGLAPPQSPKQGRRLVLTRNVRTK